MHRALACSPTHPVEVFDDAPGETRLHLDGHLDHLVEVVGRDVEDVQDPREHPAKVGAMVTRCFRTYMYSGTPLEVHH